MWPGRDDLDDAAETAGATCHHLRMFEKAREADGRKVFRCSECGAKLD